MRWLIVDERLPSPLRQVHSYPLADLMHPRALLQARRATVKINHIGASRLRSLSDPDRLRQVTQRHERDRPSPGAGNT